MFFIRSVLHPTSFSGKFSFSAGGGSPISLANNGVSLYVFGCVNIIAFVCITFANLIKFLLEKIFFAGNYKTNCNFFKN